MIPLLDQHIIKCGIPRMLIDIYGDYIINHKKQMEKVLEELSQLFYIKLENLVIGQEYIVCGNIPAIWETPIFDAQIY